MCKETHKVAHRVSEGESCNCVMTIAWLKALLDSGTYPDNMIVMLSEDATIARQITGFFTACDDETRDPYLVLTTKPDAQSETFVRTYRAYPEKPHDEGSINHE